MAENLSVQLTHEEAIALAREVGEALAVVMLRWRATHARDVVKMALMHLLQQTAARLSPEVLPLKVLTQDMESYGYQSDGRTR